ncbi:MAG: GrpB family protein [Caldilineaceae bacterium]
MPSLYTFTDYSPEWPLAFAEEATRLRTLLEPEIVTIYHVGSTSVPGLPAKPIIDLLPLVHEIERIDQYNETMTAAGYRVWGEYGLPGRRYFTKDNGNVRTHNIHIYAADHPEVTRHLAFCAYLRHHPAACAEYVQVKRRAYALHPADIMAYNNAKDSWIKATEQVALAWYQEHSR